MPETFPPNERTRVIREPQRGNYDRETIYPILDEAFICHVGFTMDSQPYVIPTMFARVGDSIYFHSGAETLYVNLFIASELEWKERGLKVRHAHLP